MVKPYVDTYKSPSVFVRKFDIQSISQDDLVWHRDKKSRVIRVLMGEGWKIQYDEFLPIPLYRNDIIFVKEQNFHRLIKGNTSHILEITEKHK